MMNSKCNGLYGFFRGGKQGFTSWFCLYPDLTIRRAFDSFYHDQRLELSWKSKDFKKIKAHEVGERGLRSVILGVNAEISKASTVWDWAAVFCFEQMKGRNSAQRDQMDVLISPEFCRIAKHIDIEEWDGMTWRNIDLFNHADVNDLARNAQWYAAKHGIIKNPDIRPYDLLNRNSAQDFF